MEIRSGYRPEHEQQSPDGVTQNCGQPINAVTNGCQNFPQLQFAAGGSITRVVGTLTSAGPQPFIIDVYANNSGESQGRRYLGSFQLSGRGRPFVRSVYGRSYDTRRVFDSDSH